MEEEKIRNPECGASLYNKYFQDLKRIFEEVLVLKSKGGDGPNICEKQKSACLIFIMLKKINRMDKYRIREGRDAMQKERIRIDSKRLQLQNLLYEVNHIKREIMRCYQFKSHDESIDLVSEEEFYADAPASISRPEITRTADHMKRLARLEWELNQRKDLFALCKELTVAKQKASEEISQKIQRLNSYGPCMKSLLKATKPLQIALDMSVEQKWAINRFVKLLSKPLYLFYMNVNAFIEIAKSNVSVAILGTEEDVRVFENIKPAEVTEECTGSDSDEIDTDAKKRKSYVRVEDVLKEQRGIVLQSHPLAVSVIINKNLNKSITINLHYFPLLEFVTAAATINLNRTGCTNGDIASPENILNYLFENDLGETSPTSNILYQLKKIKMSEADCLKYLNNKGFGKPYKWAQKMCGITIFDGDGTNSGTVVMEKTIPDIINRIQIDWNSRLSLIKQISALEKKNLDLKDTAANILRVQHSCSLVLWTAITWEDVRLNVATARFVDRELLKANNLFYRAVIVRGSSKLECFISLSNCFPVVTPIWILSVSWNGQHNALNNPAIKDMEYWTNSHVIENKSAMLATQLARTMSSFDIFLETEGQFYSPIEFSKDKPFVKPFSKRIRARPYKCMEYGPHLVFKQ